MASRIPSSPPSFSFCSSFHPPWREGILALERWRRGSPLDNASSLLLYPWWQSQPRGEGGGGEAAGEAMGEAEALREVENGAARQSRLRQ